MKSISLPTLKQVCYYMTLVWSSLVASTVTADSLEFIDISDEDIVIIDGEDYEWHADLPEPEQTDWDWQTDVYDKHSSELVYLDVIYVYSADLTAAVEAELNAYNDYTNQILANSKVHIRLRPIDYVRAELAPSDGLTALGTLLHKIDTNDEGLATLQYTKGADFLIAAYSRNINYCGNAPLGGRYGSLAESVINQAYIAVGLGCIREGSTIAHELGHALGMQHSRIQDPQGGVTFPFAIGHGVNNTMSTLMAYADVFGTRAWADYYVFSNPHLMCGEVPCGVSEKGNAPDSANAALALNLVRFQAEAYHSPGRPQIPIQTAIDAIKDPALKSCIEEYQATSRRTYAGELLEVNCTQNHITSLEGLEGFEFLRRIDVSDNPLTDIESLSALEHLVSFKADNTNLQDITPLLALENLERISVKHIAVLPCWQLDYFATDRNLRVLQRAEQCSAVGDDEDFDADGLNNREELTAGSNPLIANDEPSVIQFRFAEHAVFESEEEFKLTITRGKGQSSNVSVRIRTVAGTAQEQEDFVPLDTTVHFDRYERQKEITLRLINNPTVEEDEMFYLEISEVNNGTLGEKTRAEITIYDANQQAPLRAKLQAPVTQPTPPQPTVPQSSPGAKSSSGGSGSMPLSTLICLIFVGLIRQRKTCVKLLSGTFVKLMPCEGINLEKPAKKF